MAAVTICSDFGAPPNKVCHCFQFFPFSLPWNDEIRCHGICVLNVEFLSQLFHSPVSLLPRGSLALLCFLPLEWYHLYIWGYRYFSQQSWSQLVIHPAWHFIWCILHISLTNRAVTIYSLSYSFPSFEAIHRSMSSSNLILDLHTCFSGDR